MERDFYTRELLTQKPAVLLLGSGAELTAFVHALNKDYNIEPGFMPSHALLLFRGFRAAGFSA